MICSTNRMYEKVLGCDNQACRGVYYWFLRRKTYNIETWPTLYSKDKTVRLEFWPRDGLDFWTRDLLGGCRGGTER